MDIKKPIFFKNKLNEINLAYFILLEQLKNQKTDNLLYNNVTKYKINVDNTTGFLKNNNDNLNKLISDIDTSSRLISNAIKKKNNLLNNLNNENDILEEKIDDSTDSIETSKHAFLNQQKILNNEQIKNYILYGTISFTVIILVKELFLIFKKD